MYKWRKGFATFAPSFFGFPDKKSGNETGGQDFQDKQDDEGSEKLSGKDTGLAPLKLSENRFFWGKRGQKASATPQRAPASNNPT